MKSHNRLINQIFKAIADPTRREIFHMLVVASSALPITHVAQQFDISRQAVTKHLKLLESAGLVEIQAQGRERYCLANPKKLKLVSKWLSYYNQFWSDTLDRLDDHLDDVDDLS